jgi:hypothetical protein
VSFNSITQYLSVVEVRDGSGAHALSPGQVRIYINGSQQPVSGTSVWSDAGSSFTISSIVWEGLDVAPTPQTTYTSTSPSSIIVNARVFDATIRVADFLGLSVPGAGVTVTLANNTVVQGQTGGDGSFPLRMIPLGTYQGSVANLGISTQVSGDASSQKAVRTIVPLSYPVMFLAILAGIVALAGALVVRRRFVSQTHETVKLPRAASDTIWTDRYTTCPRCKSEDIDRGAGYRGEYTCRNCGYYWKR